MDTDVLFSADAAATAFAGLIGENVLGRRPELEQPKTFAHPAEASSKTKGRVFDAALRSQDLARYFRKISCKSSELMISRISTRFSDNC
jgi:hypothetical protein